MTMETKQLHALSKVYLEAVYGGAKKEAPKDTRLTVTNADKKANTKAYQNYKAGNKAYKAADHLKNEDAQYGYDKKGNSLNPVDIEKKKRKKDDLAGAPIKEGMKKARKNVGASKCWDGYKAKGTKMKGGKEVPNCVEEGKKADKDYDGDGKIESGKDEYFGSKDKAIKKAMGKKVKKEGFSNWRQDLKEIPDYEEIPISAKKRNEKITEKSVKNTVKINPEMKEEAQIISEKEVDVKDTRRTVDAIRAYDKSKDASRDATYDSDEGKKGKAKKEKAYAKKERGEIDKDDPNWKKKKYHTGMHGESYEATKTKEVMGALKKRDLKTSVKKKIAADIVKKKGDTSKSDDRYAYESKLWDEVAAHLTELGELNDATFKVEGYQRDPEKGEAEAKKADKRSAKQKRMDSPDRGIDSPAFKEFMRSRGM